MRFGFAIALIVIVGTGCCIPPAAADEPSPTAAIKVLRSAGARLQVDHRSGDVRKVTLRRSSQIDSDVVAAITAQPEIEYLDISFTERCKEGYAWVGRLNSLQTLKMNGLGATDADMEFTAKLTSLQRLEIKQNHLSESVVQSLTQLPVLRVIDMSGGVVPDEQLRAIEDAVPRISFVRYWDIEILEDHFLLRVNTPVADFIFAAHGAMVDYCEIISVPISGDDSFERKVYPGSERKRISQSFLDRQTGEVQVTNHLGTGFRITGDGTQLVFTDRTFDLTKENQTIFVSADNDGVFNRYRIERIRVVPSISDRVYNPPLTIPYDYLNIVDPDDDTQRDADSGEVSESYDGYRSETETRGLGPCTLSAFEYKGQFAYNLTEWTDEIIMQRGLPWSSPNPTRPTGRGATIVYEEIPRGGRTNRQISEEPTIWCGAIPGGAFPFAQGRKVNLATFAGSKSFGRAFQTVKLALEDRVFHLRVDGKHYRLEFAERGQLLRVRQLIDPNRPFGKQFTDDENRVTFERAVSPREDKPVFIIDRDGGIRPQGEDAARTADPS